MSLFVVALIVVTCSTAFAAEVKSAKAVPPKAITLGSETFAGWHEELLFGLVETHGTPTRFRFEFGRTKAYGREAYTFEQEWAYNEKQPVGKEGAAGQLLPNRIYHYRLVAWNEFGASFGQDRTFRTRPRD